MAKFRKKPVVIEAIQAEGTQESNCEIIDWTREGKTPAFMDADEKGERRLSIKTHQGTYWVEPGDWIIRGVAGGHYPVKPDVFAETYEEVKPGE